MRLNNVQLLTNKVKVNMPQMDTNANGKCLPPLSMASLINLPF